jgi:thiamine biosynthesis lipoprotein
MIRLQQHKHVLGSEAYLTVIGTDEAALAGLFDTLWQELRLFEHTFSRFLQDSELTYVNGRAGLPTEVSPEFLALALAARDFSERTGGLYNPFVLPALQRAGYKGSWPVVAELGDTPDFSDREFASGTALQNGATTVTTPSHTALDFGGIGKGYALDQIAKILLREGIENYWLSLGGDILAAGTDVDGAAWAISIGEAIDQDASCATLSVGSEPRAIATSGTIKRAGEGWNHLIDPRTGQSTKSDILSATVATDSGAAADVYAKCLILAGSQQAPKLAEKLGVAHYLLQTRNKQSKLGIIKQGDFE